MAETNNISDIATYISDEIFRRFLWTIHPKRDDNFLCVNDKHTSPTGVSKSTHPGDVVFYYDDPYLRKRVYLHTDLKSYADGSITTAMLKNAFASLCMSIECANQSSSWRDKYSVDSSEAHEVRGLLFVHNYTKGFEAPFHDLIAKTKLHNFPITPGTILHFLGPRDIQRLWSIGNDIMRLTYNKQLPESYTFYYPDLMLHRRHGDVWGQAATIESLTGPYLILKHSGTHTAKPGYVIYFNRPNATAPAFEYFLDSLSRYQMLEPGQHIQIRCTGPKSPDDLNSRFETAKQRYAKAWGFEPARILLLDAIDIATVTSVTDSFNPGVTGWRE